METHEVIIIGGGPAGASAAIYLKRAMHDVLVIDAGEKVHGRTQMATSLENYLGHTSRVTGREFMKRVDIQLKKFGVERLRDKVIKAEKIKSEFKLSTESGKQFIAKYLILAIGLIDKMPPLDDLDPYFDTAIFHCVDCDFYQNRHKKIAVAANSDDGISIALSMAFAAKPPQLSVIPTNDDFEFSDKMIRKAKEAGVEVFLSKMVALDGDSGRLKSIKLADQTLVPAEAIFTRLGYLKLDKFLRLGGIEVERSDSGFIKVNKENFETSEQNLFAIGPCNDGPDQAIVAAGEGALCAMEIDRRILADHGI